MQLGLVVAIVAIGAVTLCSTEAFPQNYPSKPIRIVTASVGSGSDLTSRLLAQEISGPLGQQVIIDNRPSGVIPSETVAKAAPDGYTILVTGGAMWIDPLLRETPYDPVRDFAPITLTETTINVLVVHPSLPVKSVQDLISLAKGKSGALNYSSTAAGSSTRIAGELFKSMAGVNIVNVPHKSSASALNDLLGGNVQLTFGNPFAVMPHVKTGRLRALAVTSAMPSPLVPGLPTVAASGLAGYEATSNNGIFAPAKTPSAIVNRLNQEIVRVLKRPDIKERYFSAGVETVGSSPDELAATVKSEMTKIGKVIKEAGIKAD